MHGGFNCLRLFWLLMSQAVGVLDGLYSWWSSPWWRGIVVKTAGSAGVLSLSCARLAAGRVTSL